MSSDRSPGAFIFSPNNDFSQRMLNVTKSSDMVRNVLLFYLNEIIN